jgi:hypothetical protein
MMKTPFAVHGRPCGAAAPSPWITAGTQVVADMEMHSLGMSPDGHVTLFS